MSQVEESITQYGFIKYSPAIADKFGITEALILAVLDKWINYYKENEKGFEKKKHFIDGYWTVYITIDELQKQILGISEKPIRNAIKHLKEVEVLKVSHHSRGPARRTNWYSIDYTMLASLMTQSKKENEEEVDSTRNDSFVDAVNSTNKEILDTVDSTMSDTVDSTSPNIRIQTLDNNKTLEEHINSCSFEKPEHGNSPQEVYKYLIEELNSNECFANTIEYFLLQYNSRFGEHPFISADKLREFYDVYYDFINDGIDYSDWTSIIDNYFDQRFSEYCDYHIHHFFSKNVISNLYHHIKDKEIVSDIN